MGSQQLLNPNAADLGYKYHYVCIASSSVRQPRIAISEYQPWLIERQRLFAAVNSFDGDKMRGLLLIE
jgi:hypothetical protein